MTGPIAAAHDKLGAVPGRIGNNIAYAAPRGAYPTADGRWVGISGTSEAVARRVFAAIERPDLADDPRFTSAVSRLQHRELLEAAVLAWTEARTAEQVEARLQALGVPAHLAASSADFAADPQLIHRGHLVRLPHGLHGEAVVEGPRYRLSETPGAVLSAAPTFGQHNLHVLRDLLGYDAARVAALQAADVLR